MSTGTYIIIKMDQTLKHKKHGLYFKKSGINIDVLDKTPYLNLCALKLDILEKSRYVSESNNDNLIKLFHLRLNTALTSPANSFSNQTLDNVKRHNMNCKRKYWSIFPKVYAESKEDDDQHETNMDRLIKSKKTAERKPLVSDEEVREYIKNETGMDRIKLLFTKRFDNTYHPDMVYILNNIQIYMVVSFMVAAVFGGRKTRMKFVEKNKARVYLTKFMAVRAAQDAQILGGLKNGWHWGLRIGMFSASFMFIAHGIATYRNKSGILEYPTAAGITCSLMRFHLGPRAMAASGVIGVVIGALGGCIALVGQRASGRTQDVSHYWYITQRLENQKMIDRLSKGNTTTTETNGI